jgi:hypothetical protein
MRRLPVWDDYPALVVVVAGLVVVLAGLVVAAAGLAALFGVGLTASFHVQVVLMSKL